ncbi:MAG: EamA family transporter [Candidatus Accumulibacter sp.]|jgi:drug/metabolite transporter (DMT)-like permease|nr:EamA family transporter [Accumulibacter sp.]
MSSRAFFIGGFLALLVFDTFAQVCFKLTALHAEPLTLDGPWLLRALSTPWVYCSILGYLGAFATWMTLLRHIPVGPAFAASHLEVIGVMVVSIPVFGEILSWLQYLGAALILAGVLCLAHDEPPRAAGENR